MNRISILLFLLICSLTHVWSQNTPPIAIPTSNWVATDALGRSVTKEGVAPASRAGKYVGVFYYLWHGSHPSFLFHNAQGGFLDITQILAGKTTWGDRNYIHYWGEPEVGYYRQTDPWVVRRHLQMFANAGVDFLYLDVTNGPVFLEQLDTLCRVSTTMRSEGIATPSLVFLTTNAKDSTQTATIKTLYDEAYTKGRCADLWFQWEGKPLILGDSAILLQNASRTTYKNYFTWRYSWAINIGTATKKAFWQWLTESPQIVGHGNDATVKEQIPVGFATWASYAHGQSYRGNVLEPVDPVTQVSANTGKGLFFQDQFDYALQVDPQVIMVTNWNEWIAQRFVCGPALDSGCYKEAIYIGGKKVGAGDSYFIDEYNQEFNRDFEPMKGGYTDNHYYKFVDYVRRFKGMPASTKGVFLDPVGDVSHRDHSGVPSGSNYTNTTGRNDIVKTTVTTNPYSLVFKAETNNLLTPSNGTNWMLLFLDTDCSKSTGWQGYDFVVNRTTISRWTGSAWSVLDTIAILPEQKSLTVYIPRSILGLTADKIHIEFHWADNIQKWNDITEFFLSGESAPDRRFNYDFKDTVSYATSLPSVTADRIVDRLQYSVIEGEWNALPDFTQFSWLSSGITDKVSISMPTPAEHFGVRLMGYLEVPNSGYYDFNLTSNDGSRMLIDDVAVITHDGVHSATTKKGGIALDSGLHKFSLEYFQLTGLKSLQLKWSGPGVAFGEVLPAYFRRRNTLDYPYELDTVSIPGVLEAERFDWGGEGQGYHDADLPNQSAGFRPWEAVDIRELPIANTWAVEQVFQGEWLDFTVNVESASYYKLGMVASLASGQGSISVLGKTVSVQATGSNATFDTTWSAPAQLSSGVQTIRVTFNSSGLSLDQILVEKTQVPVSIKESLFPKSEDRNLPHWDFLGRWINP